VAGLEEILPALARAIARHGADRVAMVVGTTTSGLGRTEDAYHELKRTGALPQDYELHLQHSFGAMMEALRRVTGVRGPCFAVSTACSASAKAVGSAQRLLATGGADAVLVGGVDALSQTTLRGFHSLQILSPVFCRPLSRERRGINIGEGVAYLLLEREGDAATRLLGRGRILRRAITCPRPIPPARARAPRWPPRSRRRACRPTRSTTSTRTARARVSTICPRGWRSRRCSARACPSRRPRATPGTCWARAARPRRCSRSSPIEQGWIPRSVGADPVDATWD
jgi:hypothetical protein